MKDKISLWSIYSIAYKDVFQLSRVNFLIILIIGFACVLPWISYELFYNSRSWHLMVLAIVGFLIEVNLQDKALLDIVDHRKQNIFEYPWSLMQAFLIQAMILGVWYIFSENYNRIGQNLLNMHIETLLFCLLFFIFMRLQFANLYILEQRCTILQAMQRSWFLTRNHNWLFERFVLLQASFIILWLLFIWSCNAHFNFETMFIPILLVHMNLMRVRIFKELEK